MAVSGTQSILDDYLHTGAFQNLQEISIQQTMHFESGLLSGQVAAAWAWLTCGLLVRCRFRMVVAQRYTSGTAVRWMGWVVRVAASWFVISCGVGLPEIGFSGFRKPQVSE